MATPEISGPVGMQPQAQNKFCPGREETYGPYSRGRDECASLGGRPRPGLSETGDNAGAFS
jgi:hypothetical protein